ncbi:MAG: serine/threonine protein kinase [bacterium]|nr:serine/threonine protein kinase [bacterium]
MTPPNEAILADLISAAMEMRDDGVEPRLEELCREHPELIAEVRAAIALSVQLPEITAPIPEKRVLANRYRLDARVGAGAMGVVHRATDKDLGRTVAVKILRAAILGEDEATARFAREAEVMAAIRHPAVVTVHDRGQTDSGETFLVMELLDGSSLSTILEHATSLGSKAFSSSTGWIAEAIAGKSPDPSYLRCAIGWCAQLADGLQAAHDSGVAHRDVKPSNVFITRDGSAKLLDFGIASRETQATITREGGALGTPAYMAPETLDDRRLLTPAVDIYGLGATLYHLVTLRAPFEGTPSQVIAAVQRRDPTPASRARRGLPRDLQAVLDCAMHRNPGRRYARPADLAADLRAFLEHRPVAARPVTATTRLLRRARRSPATIAAVTVLALVALTLGGLSWLAAVDSANRIEYWQARRGMPPNMTILTPRNRIASTPAERDYTLGLLDRAVATGVGPVPIRAMRAAYRLDHGDRDGAVEDMQVVADGVGTDYTAAVAARFTALPADAVAVHPLGLDELPRPRTRDDLLLAAFLALRDRDLKSARKWISSPELDGDLEAEHLRIYHVIDDIAAIEDRDARIAPAVELFARVSRLEAAIGHTTSHTQHVAGHAMLVQRRYGKCQELAKKSLELCPFASSAGFNAALAARRLGDHIAAVETLEKLRDARPDYYKPYWTMFFAYIDARDTERAAAVLESASFGEGAAGEWRRASMTGVLNAERAIHLALAGNATESARLAKRANAAFEAAEVISPVKSRAHWAFSQALANGRTADIFERLIDQQIGKPLNWHRLQATLDWMPKDLDEDQTAAVRRLLTWAVRTLSLQSSR